MATTRRLPVDAWIGFVLILVCGFFLSDLLGTKGSGAFVKTTTLPTVLVIVIACLSALLAGGAFLRPAGPAPEGKTESSDPAGKFRVAILLMSVGVYVAALPWLGYLVATVAFLIGANVLYGNRRWLTVLAIAIIVPVGLLLFFEKFMIILLPSSRLFG